VGLYSAWPHLRFFFVAGDQFQGIIGAWNGDWLYYVARMRDILDGHWSAAHVYAWEHKDAVNPQLPVAEAFIAGASALFHIRLPIFQAFLDFVAPTTIAAAFYALLFQLSRNRLFSALSTLLLFTIVSNGLGKPIHPQISMPILLPFLVSWMIMLNRFERREKFPALWFVIAAVCFGASFLIYFFSWAFLVVVIGTFIGLQLLQRRFRLAGSHVALMGIAGVIGAPYFIAQWIASHSSSQAEMFVRLGLFHSHMIETIPRTGVALLGLGFFVLFLSRERLWHDFRGQAVLSLLIANVVFPNHQVITGMIMQNAVHWSFMPVLLYAIASAYVLGHVSRTPFFLRSREQWAFVGAFVGLIVFPAYRLQTFNGPLYTPAKEAQALSWQRYAPLFAFLEEKTPRDSVIFANENLSKLIPAYTHNNVYYVWDMFYLPGSDEEVMQRYLCSRINMDRTFFQDPTLGITPNNRPLWTQPGATEMNVHANARRLGFSTQDTYTVKREIAFAQRIAENIKTRAWTCEYLVGTQTKVRLDYVIWDQKTNPDWNLFNTSKLIEIFRKNDVVLYQVLT